MENELKQNELRVDEATQENAPMHDASMPMTTVTEDVEGRLSDDDEAADADALLMLWHYLDSNYELRNNVLSDKLEFRPRYGKDSSFRQLTVEAENSIIIDATLAMGDVKHLKSNLSLLLHSEKVQQFNPIREYLTTLPHWDGRNRVSELFGRLPGISSENILRCTIWLRSAVAHWMQMDAMYGNDVVPTLIGDQGCGKTVFCRRLLPSCLNGYFLDRMNLSNKFDKDMALTNNLLVVLDEFDQYSISQQASLKQALSRNVVNARPVFKGTQVMRHRFASFLATTNNIRPLTDPTGSRRYICIRLTPGAIIDNERPIDYDQLYAQVMYEVAEAKMRYWFDADETRQLQQDNMPFHHEVDVCEMVNTCFAKPTNEELGHEYTMNEIVEMIAMRYPQVSCNMAMKMRVGGALRKLGYAVRHHKNGNSYVLMTRKAA